MISSNAIANHIISTTSDETFESDFAKISEVRFFIEKYPNYTTGHLADFLGWKVINYSAKINDERYVHLSVKKSVLHQGVKVSAGCSQTGTNYALDIIDEQVMDYLKNDRCLLREKSSEEIWTSEKLSEQIKFEYPPPAHLEDEDSTHTGLGPKTITYIQSNSPYRDCPRIMEKLHNTPGKELQAEGFGVYPGNVGYVHQDHINKGGIYIDHPDIPGEKILDLDAMMKLPQPTCSFYEKAIFGD